jgi:hypothetical protein
VACAVFSLVSLSKTKNTDLFIAATVFLAPMAFCSVASAVFKMWLMQRRLKQRRADRPRAGLSKLALTPAARQAALRMLMERFVLRHDQLDFQDRMGANDVCRYETYFYMMHILSEVRTRDRLPSRAPSAKAA